jgi:hypothetical protein
MEEHMKVKIKKLHEDAVIPSYSKAGDAGMDLYSFATRKIRMETMFTTQAWQWRYHKAMLDYCIQDHQSQRHLAL